MKGWPFGATSQGLEGFDICESRTRSTDGQGFDSPQVHVNTTRRNRVRLDDEAAMERYRIDRSARWIRADEVADRLTEEDEDWIRREMDDFKKRIEDTKGGK